MSHRLLREFIRGVLNEGYTNENEGPSWANWYHLSAKDLGEEFTFTPRIPYSPFEAHGGVIEDDITERTSWAPSIEAALGAIGPQSHINKEWFIYAVPNLPGEVDLQDEFQSCDDRVGSPGNEYGIDWSYDKYEDQIWDDIAASPDRRTPEEANAMKSKIKQDLKKCVPDAPQTGEHWATEPAVAKKIGVIKKNHAEITWL